MGFFSNTLDRSLIKIANHITIVISMPSVHVHCLRVAYNLCVFCWFRWSIFHWKSSIGDWRLPNCKMLMLTHGRCCCCCCRFWLFEKFISHNGSSYYLLESKGLYLSDGVIQMAPSYRGAVASLNKHTHWLTRNKPKPANAIKKTWTANEIKTTQKRII